MNEDFPLTIGNEPFSEKDNEEISIVHNDITQWDLHIKNVQLKHSGQYECQISVTNGMKHFVELTVLSEYLQDITVLLCHRNHEEMTELTSYIHVHVVWCITINVCC